MRAVVRSLVLCSVIIVFWFGCAIPAPAEGTWTYHNTDKLGGWALIMAAEPGGGMWVGRRGALIYYNGTDWEPFTNDEVSLHPIHAMAVNRAGVVYYGVYENVYSFDGSRWETILGGEEEMHPYGMLVDNNNTLWFSAGEKGLYHYDGDTLTHFASPFKYGVQVRAVTVDNALWCSHNGDNFLGNGASLFKDGEWIHFTTEDGLAGEYVSDIAVDADGMVWFGTLNGVSRFDGEEWTTLTAEDGLVGNEITGIAVDMNNIKWISAENGLSEYDGETWTTHYRVQAAIRIVVDAQNRKWFDTRSGGHLICYDDHRIPFVWVTGPRGRELWGPGTEQEITWEAYDVATVDICYSTDDGESWTLIADNIDSTPGNFFWTLPDLQSDRCLIRVSDAENPLIADTCNATFTVSHPYVVLTRPEGGEVWEAASTQEIRWDSFGLSTVSLEFSADNGETWETIDEGIDASTGVYEWTIPDDPSDHCFVRIFSTENGTIADTNESPFVIPQNMLTLVTPDSGEFWQGAVYRDITWIASSIVATIRIEYSRDGGESWRLVAEHVDAADGYYSWRLPHIDSDSCLVRISAENVEMLSDESDGFFSIHPPRVWEDSWMKSYSDTDRIRCLAVSGDFIWCGTVGAAVRVNRFDNTITIFRVNQGLVHNDIRDIAVQSDGTLWFGTADGVSSYNGSSWTSYTTGNGLEEGEITAIAVDGDDTVWIGEKGTHCKKMDCWTVRALQYFDGEIHSKLSSKYYYTDMSYRELAYDPSSNGLWVSNSTGTPRYDLPDFSSTESIQGGIIEMQIDSEGAIWAVLSDGSVYSKDGVTTTIYTSDNSDLPGKALAVSLDENGAAWIGTENGLCRFDGGKWTIWTSEEGLAHDTVNAVLVDEDNVVWAGTEAGLSRFGGGRFLTVSTVHTLSTNRVSTIAVGPDDTQWFGSYYGGGISIFKEGATCFITYDEDAGGLPHWEIYDIVHDDSGVVWIATPEGVSRFDGNSWITYSEQTGSLTDNFVKDLLFDKNGILWVMSYSGELASFDGITWKSHTPCDWYVNQIALDHFGNIWAAGDHVYVYRPDTGEWTQYEDPTPPHCRCVAVDHDNVIWAAGTDGNSNNLIVYYKDGVWEQLHPVPVEVLDNQVTAIAEDADGALWFGLDKGGVASYCNGEWNIYTRENSGLIDNHVLTITVDRNNVKWIGTVRGATALYTPAATSAGNHGGTAPRTLQIIGNYPNPFNPSTTIEYEIHLPSHVSLNVYSISGQKAVTLVEEFLPAGRYSAVFNGSSLASGLYILRLEAGGMVKTAKMTLVK